MNDYGDVFDDNIDAEFGRITADLNMPPVDDSKPIYAVNYEGFVQALKSVNAEMWHHTRENRPYLNGKPMTDIAEADLRTRIAETCLMVTGGGKKVKQWEASEPKWRLWLQTHQERTKRDPFSKWLLSRPAWDGVERRPLAGWAEVDEDSLLVAYAEWAPICHAVRRTLYPGAIVQDITVLIGAQGCGKSSWLQFALGGWAKDLWCDRFTFAADENKQIEKVMGSVFVEIGELEKARRNDIAHIKETISQHQTKVRLPYARRAEIVPATWVYYATANDTFAIPSDTTGSRRFLPVEMKQDRLNAEQVADVKRWWDENRDQVWVEAIERVHTKNYPVLPPVGIWEEQDQLNAQHQFRSDVELNLHQWLIDHPVDKLTIIELLHEANVVPRDRRLGEVNRVILADARNALKTLGYVSKNIWIEGKVVSGWELPGGKDRQKILSW